MGENDVVCISSAGCLRNNITPNEAILLLAFRQGVSYYETVASLAKKGLIIDRTNEEIEMEPIGNNATINGSDAIEAIIASSFLSIQDTLIGEKGREEALKERLTKLAAILKDIFPKGKKDGTYQYWSEGTALIVRRLVLFIKKYGDIYTDEQIIDAAKKYVESFNGNYAYMRTLKYFILKEVKGAAGDVEGTSDLINYIENAGETDNLKQDWTSQLN